MMEIKIIKVCAILIAVCILFNTVTNIYFNQKNIIRNHDVREIMCNTGDNLIYIKSVQINKEIIICCEVQEDHGVNHIVYCEDILISK